MPIPFECSCGRKMSAKEEFAGRRLRCPECQRVVTIPKPGSALLPTIPHGGSPPAATSRVSIQPDGDSVPLDVTRPTSETLPPPTTPTFDSPENLEALFAPTLTKTPILSSAPLPAPAPPPSALIAPALPPEEEPAVTPVIAFRPEPPPPENSWVDQSLEQVATPWLPGDEHFQIDVPAAREAETPLEWIVPVLIVAACLLLAIF
jgi:hypothetical protein